MLSQYITQKTSWKLAKNLLTYLRNDLFNAIISKEPVDFKKKELGEYNSMLINDVTASEEYIEHILLIAESIIGLVVYAAYIFTLSYKIAIVIYLTAIITLFMPKLTGNKLSNKKQNLLSETGRYTSKVIDLLRGYPLVNKDTRLNMEKRHKNSLLRMESVRYKYGSYKTFVNVLNGSIMYIINISALP